MIRGSTFRAALGALALVGTVVPLSTLQASSAPVVGDNARTLVLSIPGPFRGCTYLDPGASQSDDALLDLVRPSAFLTNSNGNLVGSGAPIASAELTSLNPETVVYTIAPHETWSNGAAFNGVDLVAWWHHARQLASVLSDGYRAIGTLRLSADSLTLTATFARPYADWNTLFRDVENRSVALGCSIAAMVARPSLGPYVIAAASASKVVLTMNHSWPTQLDRFGRVVIEADGAIPSNPSAPFVSYVSNVDRAEVQASGAHPSLLSHIGSSATIEEMTFAPARPLSRRILIREALSWSLDRQSAVNQLFGAVTFSPSLGASALFSQGQGAYPGNDGIGPTGQATTTTTTTPVASSSGPPDLADCAVCARDALRSAGFHYAATGWFNAAGAPLAVRVVVGPSSLDRATAAIVEHQWRNFGLSVYTVGASSELNAAATAAFNNADVAIFARPTLTTPTYTARSWTGPAYGDTYLGGFRSPVTNALYAKAITTFNPVAAMASWRLFDQFVMTSFWVRPLFTAPSLIEWSGTVGGVYGSASIPGFVDEASTWNLTGLVSGHSSTGVRVTG